MKISVLDQSPLRDGTAQDESIRETLALARHCDALGYYRYWVSEHHNDAAVAGTAPEILMAVIAGTTSRIRVGSAGVMLPNYSALKVAEQFRVLEAIAPGRIDLGVGRVAGGDPRTAHALNPNAARAAEQFPHQVRDLQAWTSGKDLPMGHPFRGVRALPSGPFAPQIWILGSSVYGAQMAGFFGLPYCFAHFLTGGRGAREALDIYREKFCPNELHPTPHSAVTLAALAAETQQQADANCFSRPADGAAAAGGELTLEDQAKAGQVKQFGLVGEAAEVAERIRALAAALGVDEVAITTYAHDPAVRRNSYSLLAREFRLSEAPEAAKRIRGAEQPRPETSPPDAMDAIARRTAMTALI
jgi:luciferase family oxidoreductase group 1